MSTVVACGAAFVCSFVITGVALRYARRRNMLDFPDARRVHSTAVPRGGGIAILVTVTLGLIIGLTFDHVSPSITWCVLLAGLAFGALGWLDDHASLSAAFRFSCQLVIACAFCAALVFLGTMPLDGFFVLFLFAAPLILVWIVNAFNFMDGADGFAISECLLVAGFSALIALRVNFAADGLFLAALLIGACAGFLWWNWSPARIFLGDVGSYSIGYYLCALASFDFLDGRAPWPWLILFVPFLSDATWTLLRRMFNHEPWWQAHRSHLYQKLILRGVRHESLVYGLCTISVFVLLPTAWYAAHNPHSGFAITSIVYLIAGIIWYSSNRLLDRVE